MSRGVVLFAENTEGAKALVHSLTPPAPFSTLAVPREPFPPPRARGGFATGFRGSRFELRAARALLEVRRPSVGPRGPAGSGKNIGFGFSAERRGMTDKVDGDRLLC